MTSRWAHLVARELRIEARGPNLSSERCWGALWATGSILWSTLAPPAASLADRWYLSFVAVATLGASLSLLAGLRHAARALAEEIRDGTLELLLGTEVTIPEVVFGCFTAKFLRAFGELLPLVPLLLLCAGMSGRRESEFWRVVSVLLALLFSSVAIASLAAACARDERQSLSATLIFLYGTAVWLPLVGVLTEPAPLQPVHNSLLVLCSPIVAFRKALDSGFQLDPEGFYRSLLIQISLGITALVAASVALRQRFRSQSLMAALRNCFPVVRFLVGRNAKAALRLLPDPRAWAIHHWALSLFPLIAASAVILSLMSGDRVACEWSFAALFASHLNFKLCLALEATTGLREARRLGNLLLELAAPIHAAESLERHATSVSRQFRCPLLSLFVAHGSILTALGLLRRSPFAIDEELAVVVVLVVGLLQVFTDRYALLWFGMWNGLTRADGGRALVRTLGRVVFLPWAALWVLAVPNFGIFPRMNEGAAYFICWTALGTALSLIVGATSKHCLHGELRSRA